MIDLLPEFKDWLDKHTAYNSNVKKDILSRINRANSIKPWVSEETYIFYLEKDEVFKALSCSVKSQLRKAVKLYSQFRDEIKREA